MPGFFFAADEEKYWGSERYFLDHLWKNW